MRVPELLFSRAPESVRNLASKTSEALTVYTVKIGVLTIMILRNPEFRIFAVPTDCTIRNLNIPRKPSSATAFMKRSRNTSSVFTGRRCFPWALNPTLPTGCWPDGNRRGSFPRSSPRTLTACTRRRAAKRSMSFTAPCFATTAPAAGNSTVRNL